MGSDVWALVTNYNIKILIHLHLAFPLLPWNLLCLPQWGKKNKQNKKTPKPKNHDKIMTWFLQFTTSYIIKVMLSSGLNTRLKGTKWVPVLCSSGPTLSDGDTRFHFAVSNSIKPDTLNLVLTPGSSISFNNLGQPSIFIIKSFPVHQ